MEEYRGKGVSKDKMCKGTNIPKHAGNFSYKSIHYHHAQSKDYKVRMNDNNQLIVGEHTPLEMIMPCALGLILNDPNFKSYTQTGTHTHNGKQYEAVRSLSKFGAYMKHSYLDYKFVLRETIYTDGDFNYQFPNY